MVSTLGYVARMALSKKFRQKVDRDNRAYNRMYKTTPHTVYVQGKAVRFKTGTQASNYAEKLASKYGSDWAYRNVRVTRTRTKKRR